MERRRWASGVAASLLVNAVALSCLLIRIEPPGATAPPIDAPSVSLRVVRLPAPARASVKPAAIPPPRAAIPKAVLAVPKGVIGLPPLDPFVQPAAPSTAPAVAAGPAAGPSGGPAGTADRAAAALRAFQECADMAAGRRRRDDSRCPPQRWEGLAAAGRFLPERKQGFESDQEHRDGLEATNAELQTQLSGARGSAAASAAT